MQSRTSPIWIAALNSILPMMCRLNCAKPCVTARRAVVTVTPA